MPRYLIELTHSDEHTACVRALRAIEQYGSHFVTQANWGCKAGIHCGWLIVEVDSREEVMQIIPIEFRPQAKVTQVNRVTRETIASKLKELEE